MIDFRPGKTTWLYLVLVLRLHARLPTIYQFGTRQILFFDDHGASLLKRDLDSDALTPFLKRNGHDGNPTRVWALVDSNQELISVDQAYYSHRIFTVQTPSPRQDRIQWTKKLNGPYQRFILAPWILSELICAWVQICSRNMDD